MKDRYTPYTLFSVIIAALGGFLFGYYAAVISPALIFLAKDFHLDSLHEGVLVSIMILGAWGGSIFSGSLADLLGRKKTFCYQLYCLF